MYYKQRIIYKNIFDQFRFFLVYYSLYSFFAILPFIKICTTEKKFNFFKFFEICFIFPKLKNEFFS